MQTLRTNDTHGSGISAASLPGKHLNAQRMPGHWLLARLEKHVLRSGVACRRSVPAFGDAMFLLVARASAGKGDGGAAVSATVAVRGGPRRTATVGDKEASIHATTT